MRRSKRPVDRRPVDFWGSVNRCCFPDITAGYKKSAAFRSTHVDLEVDTIHQSYQLVRVLLTVLTAFLRYIIDLYIYNYIILLDSIHSLFRTLEQKRIKSQQDVFCSSVSKVSVLINRSTRRSTVVNRSCNLAESLTATIDLFENGIWTILNERRAKCLISC